MSFICPLSWSSTFFSVNAFNSLFFNLLTFSKRGLDLAGSVARSQSHLLCVARHVIGCSLLMSHIHVHTLHKLRTKAWVDKESWCSASWYQQRQIWVLWLCQLKTNPVTRNYFSYRHGTVPRFREIKHYIPCSPMYPSAVNGCRQNESLV